MKNKALLFRLAQHRALALPLAFTLALVGAAQAADLYWDGAASAVWGTAANWSTDATGTTNPGAAPAGGDAVFFNITSANGNNTVIDLTANRNTEQLIFSNTGTTGFRANTSVTTARTLSINPGGILMNAGAGAVTFGVDSGTNGQVYLSFNATTNSITNNSSSNLNINNRVQSTAVGGATITNNGNGMNYVGMGELRSTVAKIVQDSATSDLGLRANSSTFAGNVEILKGTVKIGTSANNFGTSAGQVNLGSSAPLATAAATIEINDNSSQTYTAKPIILGTTSGLLKIVLRDDSGTNTHTITGAISGANNLTLENQANGLNTDDKLTFNTGGINNVGTITHIGDGTGDLTINSVIGANITGVIQNSATSRMVLTNNANTYTGATDVNAGTLVINGNISTSGITTVHEGATLTGNGTVGKAVVNGTLSVGNSPGTMTFTDTLNLVGTTVMEIDGIAGTGVTGGHDLVNLTGAGVAGVLTYGGVMTLDIGTIFGVGTYSWNLFDFASETGGFTGITLADQYSGSLTDAGGGIWGLTSGDNTWSFTESNGVVGLTVIPEPRAALLGGLGLLALLRRRR